MRYKQRNYSKYTRATIVCVTHYMNIQSFLSETELNFFRFILNRRQLKLFVHQKHQFVRYEKHFQGEIAIRSQDIAINKKVPQECSDDRATHLTIQKEN